MGSSYEFKCATCGLRAEVSGGDDRGMVVKTCTMYCRVCRALADIAIGFYDHPILDRTKEDEASVGKCPTCGGIDLVRWKALDPCPNCGASVTKGIQTALWD